MSIDTVRDTTAEPIGLEALGVIDGTDHPIDSEVLVAEPYVAVMVGGAAVYESGLADEDEFVDAKIVDAEIVDKGDPVYIADQYIEDVDAKLRELNEAHKNEIQFIKNNEKQHNRQSALKDKLEEAVNNLHKVIYKIEKGLKKTVSALIASRAREAALAQSCKTYTKRLERLVVLREDLSQSIQALEKVEGAISSIEAIVEPRDEEASHKLGVAIIDEDFKDSHIPRNRDLLQTLFQQKDDLELQIERLKVQISTIGTKDSDTMASQVAESTDCLKTRADLLNSHDKETAKAIVAFGAEVYRSAAVQEVMLKGATQAAAAEDAVIRRAETVRSISGR